MGSGLIYLDTSAIIRLLEGPAHLGRQVTDLAGSRRYATCTLSIVECLTRPLRDQNRDFIDLHERFFASDDVDVFPVTAEVARAAADVRAHHRLKTPDAIHYAAARSLACEAFITTDAIFQRCREDGELDILIVPAI